MAPVGRGSLTHRGLVGETGHVDVGDELAALEEGLVQAPRIPVTMLETRGGARFLINKKTNETRLLKLYKTCFLSLFLEPCFFYSRTPRI